MDTAFDQHGNARLFDRLPDGFFAPLSRKYKAVYAYALITLYHCLKIYRSRILKADYMAMLRSHGQDIMDLFSIQADKADDREEGEEVDEKANQPDDKFAYVVRKLMTCGWFQIDRDYKSGNDYVFLPSYSIRMLELLDSLTSDVSTYMPLVHQTYSELQLEDQKEDEYMYRSLANAVHSSDELELSVTLLHHSIVVFKHRLTNVFSPNEALHQHFDDFKTEVGDPIYHPMKTYDSLGLYSRPTVEILTRWLRDERLVAKLASQARLDPTGQGLSIGGATDLVIASLNRVIDVFDRLNHSFQEIDKANSDYTEAVQRKVNYLAGTDRSMKGKLDKICASLAGEMKKHPNADGETSTLLAKVMDTVSLYRGAIFDSDSLFMPFRRERRTEEDPMGLPADFDAADSEGLMNDFLSNEVSQYSEEAIDAFMKKAFAGKGEITSSDVPIDTIDDLVLFILGLVKAEFNTSFFTIKREKDEIVSHGYRMPLYVLTRKEIA